MMPSSLERIKAPATVSTGRSFQRDVAEPLGRLPHVATEILCQVASEDATYPIFAVRSIPSNPLSPSLLISGGVHGDEPAGVYTAIEFLTHLAPKHLHAFNFIVLPCVNPSGFERGTLETATGVNLNRVFGTNTSQPEVRAIEQWLADKNSKFRATFDLHEIVPDYRGEGFDENDNPRACYLYETALQKDRRIGRQMIAALPDSVEVCDWPTIYQDENSGGVVSYPDACRNAVYAEQTTFESYLHGRYTDHAFTTETPTGWSMKKRVNVQLIWLETALELLR